MQGFTNVPHNSAAAKAAADDPCRRGAASIHDPHDETVQGFTNMPTNRLLQVK